MRFGSSLRLIHDNIGIVDHFGKRLHVASTEGVLGLEAALVSKLVLLLTAECTLLDVPAVYICVQIRGL